MHFSLIVRYLFISNMCCTVFHTAETNECPSTKVQYFSINILHLKFKCVAVLCSKGINYMVVVSYDAFWCDVPYWDVHSASLCGSVVSVSKVCCHLAICSSTFSLQLFSLFFTRSLQKKIMMFCFYKSGEGQKGQHYLCWSFQKRKGGQRGRVVD